MEQTKRIPWPGWDSLKPNGPHECKEAKIRSDSHQVKKKKNHPVRLEQLCGYFLNLNFSWILKRSLPHYVEESLWPWGRVCSAAVCLATAAAKDFGRAEIWKQLLILSCRGWHPPDTRFTLDLVTPKKESVNETESLQRIFDLDSRYENSPV